MTDLNKNNNFHPLSSKSKTKIFPKMASYVFDDQGTQLGEPIGAQAKEF